MRSRPTWTRYGNAIVMMKRATTQHRREGEKPGISQADPCSPIFSDLPPEPTGDEGEADLLIKPVRFASTRSSASPCRRPSQPQASRIASSSSQRA